MLWRFLSYKGLGYTAVMSPALLFVLVHVCKIQKRLGRLAIPLVHEPYNSMSPSLPAIFLKFLLPN